MIRGMIFLMSTINKAIEGLEAIEAVKAEKHITHFKPL
jgi:hypothetical protein